LAHLCGRHNNMITRDYWHLGQNASKSIVFRQ
jgi:hypothetical protein